MSMIDITSRELAEKNGFLDRMPDMKLPKAPPMRVNRLVLALFVLGFGIFGGLGVWASYAQMTSAVVASGSFRVAGDRLEVEHLEGGIVREINVLEGDTVQEGEILVVIDGTRAKSQMGIMRSQLVSALSQEIRLRAELDGAAEMLMTDQLAGFLEQDSRLNKLFEAQKSIFHSNEEMLDGQVKILNERKAQLHEQTNGFDARRTAYQRQLELVQQEIENMEGLYQKGLVTGSRMTNLRQNESSVMGNLGALDSNLQNVLQRVVEVEERILQVRRDRLTTVAQALLQAQETVFDMQERIDTIIDVEARQKIRAPRSGRVVGLNVNTIGSVIAPGQTLLDIVPTDASFVVEAQVKPTDIDEVIPGGPAQVRLTAYNFRTTLPVDGEVVHISADSLINEATGASYYRVDVKVPTEALAALGDGNVRVIPGMPAQVMIETGEQTLMDYLLNPVMASFDTALKEGN
jgi:membrane fusion protein, type I secretion system